MGRIPLVGANQVAQLSRQGVAVLVAVALAQSPIPASEIGHYEQLQYVAYLLSFAWTTGLLQSLLAVYGGQEERRQKSLLFWAALAFLALSIAVLLPIWLQPAELIQILTGSTSLSYLFLFSGYLIGHWPSLLVEYIYNLKEQGRSLIWFALISNGLFLVAVVVPPYIGYSLEESFRLLIGLGLLKFGWLLRLLYKYSYWQWEPEVLRKWVQTAAPLILYALLGALSMSFDPWFVGQRFDGASVPFAIYRYGSRELPLVGALTVGIFQGVLPRFSRQPETALEELRRASVRLMHLLFPVSIVLLLTSRWWFRWVFTEAFADSIPIFNTFLLITISRMVFATVPIIGLQRSNAMPFLILLSLGGNALFSYLLFPYFGLLGIAWGTVLAFSLEKWGMILYLRSRLQIRLGQYCGTGWLLFYGSLLLGAYLIGGEVVRW